MGSNSASADTSQLRDAASVVLIRDGAPDLEAFTLTRSPTMASFPNATVFPGGGVDSADTLPDEAWEGTDLSLWARTFDDDESSVRRLLVAAVRETFEECGVLLAERLDSSSLSPQDYAAARSAVENRELDMGEFLVTHGLKVDFSLLRPLARWVTPEGNPRRYDTRFFLAQLPAGQHAMRTTGEATLAQWMSPEVAFSLFREGKTHLMPPTWSMFRTLSGFASAAEALSAQFEPRQVTPTIARSAPPQRVDFPYADEYYAQ